VPRAILPTRCLPVAVASSSICPFRCNGVTPFSSDVHGRAALTRSVAAAMQHFIDGPSWLCNRGSMRQLLASIYHVQNVGPTLLGSVRIGARVLSSAASRKRRHPKRSIGQEVSHPKHISVSRGIWLGSSQHPRLFRRGFLCARRRAYGDKTLGLFGHADVLSLRSIGTLGSIGPLKSIGEDRRPIHDRK